MYKSLDQASEALDNSPVSENINPNFRSLVINEMFQRGLTAQAMYNEFRNYQIWIKPDQEMDK